MKQTTGRLGPSCRLEAGVALTLLCMLIAAIAAAPASARRSRGARHHAHAARHHRRHRRAHAGKAKRRHSQGGGERKLEASIALKLSPPEPSLPQVQTINLFVPKGFRDAGGKLPFCNPAFLDNKEPEKCPKKTIVGNGTSLGYVFFEEKHEYVPEHLKLTMYNGPHGGLLTWIEGQKPVEIEEVVKGVITAPHGFGQELAFTIPNGLLEPLPGAHGWLIELHATLSGKKGWLRTKSCPPHPWNLKAEFGYTNGQGISVQTKLACR